MKVKIAHIGLTILTSLLFITTASAQRTQSGQPSLRVSSLYNGLFVGAEAFYEQYTLSGYWQTGVSGNLYKANLSSGDTLDYLHVIAEGGFLFRLAGTRSRSLNLYAGGGALAGVELLDPFSSLPEHIALSQKQIAFIYGVYAQGVLEWFVARKFAILLQASSPLTFGSGIRVVNGNVGIGLKLNL